MAILERINQMKQHGLNDEQIIQNLREQGVSPREINEALDQNKVKSAISNGPGQMSIDTMQIPTLPETMDDSQMQPSLMQPHSENIDPMQMAQQTMSMQRPTQQITQETQAAPQYQDYGYEQQPYTQYPQYAEYPQYQHPAETDTETMTDIASQIVDEKLEKINKQIQNLEKLKTETKGRILDIDARLTRIEKTIDLLQTSILGKIGEYWKNVSDLKDEMQATQESFSKILNPLSEQMEKIRAISGATKNQPVKGMTETEKKRGRPRAKSNREDGFAHYLR